MSSSAAFRTPEDDILARLASGQLTEPVTKVDLTNRGLTSFPNELFAVRETLEILNLGGNHLSELPEALLQFTKLRVLFLGSNDFVSVPSFLGRMTSLFMLSFKSNKLETVPAESLSPSVGWLILTDNRLNALPASIGRLAGLRKLMLANNRLESLPAELASCRQLELIRLSRNNLAVFPDWLFALPRLTWLALSGNPASDVSGGEVPNVIHSSQLSIGEVMGQGASGFVHKVESRHDAFSFDTSRYDGIAVKLFKGDCSSDGHPSDEVYVSGRVGAACPNILPVLACISEEEGSTDPVSGARVKFGLVFPLIPKDCGVLALPPSFASVTRDVYESGAAFSPEKGLKILLGLASAGSYMHNRGIMHGDLYGHNIHVYEDGQPVLVDFGAATAYGLFTTEESRWKFEALDVRAFGCLMEEVLERLSGGSVSRSVSELRDLCLSEDPAERPSFAAIQTALEEEVQNNNR